MGQIMVIHLVLEVQDMVEEARLFLVKYYPFHPMRTEVNLSRNDHHLVMFSYCIPNKSQQQT
jgi:hypothetical protein